VHAHYIALRCDEGFQGYAAGDHQHEAKFAIKEMMVRSEWDRLQRHIDEKMRAADDHEAEVRWR
jgi:hypothetical protein